MENDESYGRWIRTAETYGSHRNCCGRREMMKLETHDEQIPRNIPSEEH